LNIYIALINSFITAQTAFCHCTFSIYHCTFCASLRIKNALAGFSTGSWCRNLHRRVW